jgi:anthraniloyl-CoA monooxygenase
MKRQDAAHEITVWERNAPDDTFGWGVVFSDRTLAYLRDSDEPTHEAITRAFATWDNVDVVHRDARVTIRGNKFSGIARLKLLHILQARCQDLGVALRFRANVSEPEALARACDLLVGADGVNSEVRARYAEYFAPELSVRHNRYIWYGTHQLFHGLTLTFRETEAGVFAAHSYKFDQTTSTFIVECDEETWQRAGCAAQTDEETRAYLAAVFARDLDGHALLSNNSKWLNFLLVKNRHWQHQNIVLLGDALHTAHFSIGSGTKLALEDAIALAHCFVERQGVPAALAQFERVRKPVVEEYQRAAYDSLVWFEHARDYVHLPPLPFAYSLMTRSKRITYESLKRRDPEFIKAYEAAVSKQDNIHSR